MQSRRSFLAASSTLTTVAVAGCSDILGGDDGSDGSDGGSGGRYSDLVAETDERPVNVTVQKISELAANENYGGVGADEQFLGLQPSDAEYAVNVTLGTPGAQGNGYGMVFGPFELEDVRSELEGQFQEISETDAINGFDTVEGSAGEGTFYYGTNDEALAFGTSRDLYETATALLDGDQSSLFESSDDFDNLAGIIGDPQVGQLQLEPEQLQTDPTGDAVAGAAGIELGEEESEYTSGVTYETEDEASENESAVGDAVVETESAIDEVETEVDGRTVIVTATATTSEL